MELFEELLFVEACQVQISISFALPHHLLGHPWFLHLDLQS
jgi:hypothetical protein